MTREGWEKYEALCALANDGAELVRLEATAKPRASRERRGKPEWIDYQLKSGAIVPKLMIPVLDDCGNLLRYTDGVSL